MEILWTILIGFVVGLFARFLKPGDDSAGFILTTVLGVVGAVVGAFLGRMLGMYAPGQPAGFVMSIIGAIIVLFAYTAIAGKKQSV